MAKITITSLQAKILSHIELSPDLGAAEVARRIGTRAHTVHYNINRLLDGGVIQRRSFIDISRLGFIDVGVFLTLAISSASKLKSLYTNLQKEDSVRWLEELSGGYQVHFAMHCRRFREVLALLAKVSDWSGNAIVSRSISPRARYYQYRHKMFGRVSSAEPVVAFEESTLQDTVKLSEDDIALLGHLANNDFQSLRQTARDLKSPYSTIEKRLKRLEQLKVYRGQFYDINVSALGFHQYKLLLFCSGQGASLERAIEKFCRQHPLVTYMLVTVGEWDFEIGVVCNSPIDLPRLIGCLHEEFVGRVLRVTTLNELETLKYSYFPRSVDYFD